MIVITYADYEDAELDGFEPRVVHVDAHNRVHRRGRRPPGRELEPPGTPTGLTRRADAPGPTRPAGHAVAGRSTCWCSAAGWPACRPPCALAGPARRGLRVGVLTKGELSQSATRWAQGGVAAVLGGDEDSTDLHLADTLAAGAGLCDADAVRVLVDEGPGRVHELIALGAEFDRRGPGGLALAREGGHSHAPGGPRRRGGHRRRGRAGPGRGHPGRGRRRARAAGSPSTCWWRAGGAAGSLALGSRRRAGRGPGRPRRAGHRRGRPAVRGHHQPPARRPATGVAMALRAGVPVADVEFMQFHPTALHHPAMPRPLLSEALRGHGALLRDARGERFVDELAPRDVVSRAMTARMLDQGVDHLWLDATGLDAFDERFPTIAASLPRPGSTRRPTGCPIAPAAHYLSGGVRHRPRRGTVAARPVGGRRGGLHRRARRQPAGLQLAARGDGVRGPGGRGHRRRDGRARGRPGAMRAVLGRRRRRDPGPGSMRWRRRPASTCPTPVASADRRTGGGDLAKLAGPRCSGP